MRPAVASILCLGRDQMPIMPSTFTSTWQSEHTAIGYATGIYESLKRWLRRRSRRPNQSCYARGAQIVRIARLPHLRPRELNRQTAPGGDMDDEISGRPISGIMSLRPE